MEDFKSGFPLPSTGTEQISPHNDGALHFPRDHPLLCLLRVVGSRDRKSGSFALTTPWDLDSVRPF